MKTLSKKTQTKNIGLTELTCPNCGYPEFTISDSPIADLHFECERCGNCYLIVLGKNSPRPIIASNQN